MRLTLCKDAKDEFGGDDEGFSIFYDSSSFSSSDGISSRNGASDSSDDKDESDDAKHSQNKAAATTNTTDIDTDYHVVGKDGLGG
eukprot:3129781-Ditylum_brightwellii.AAC.1